MPHRHHHHQESIYSALIIQPAAVVFLVIALVNRRLDLMLLMLLVLVIMTGARLWSRASLRNLVVHTSVDRLKLFPNEQLRVHVRIENRKWLPVRLRLEMFVGAGLRPPENDAVRECGLLWHQGIDFHWNLRACQRGVYSLGAAQITAGDFFGFYLKSRKIQNTPVEIVVYPGLRTFRDFAFIRKELFGIAGAKSAVQDPVYIVGTRDYQAGVPARFIHWKASARYNRLQEKIFAPSSQAKVFFLVDAALFARHNAGENFERTLETAASLAVQCDLKGFALGFLTNGEVTGGMDRLPVSGGPERISAFLETLARLKMQSTRSLIDRLRDNWSLPSGASVVCFVHHVDEDAREVALFLKHRRISAIFVAGQEQPGEARGFMPNAMTLDDILGKEVSA